MRLLFLGVMTLWLLSGCVFYQYDKSLTALHGASITQAVDVLGPPTSREGNTYVWSKSRMVRGGGFYTTVYQTRYEHNAKGKPVARQMPEQRWVPPYTERLWCITTIHTSGDGIITGHNLDGNDCP